MGKVLTNRDWDRVEYIFRKKGAVVLDDFLKPGLCEELHKFAVMFKKRDVLYLDYRSLKLAPNQWDEWFPLLQDIVDESRECIPFLNKLKFNRGWYFDYDYISNGVLPHCDPGSQITTNLWVTPDKAMIPHETEERNGLSIWREHKLNVENLNGLVSQSELNHDRRMYVPYKCNRLAIFPSTFAHASAKVRTHTHRENVRVNYTLMYGDIRDGHYKDVASS